MRPPPRGQLVGGDHARERQRDERREDDGELLARGLPRAVEAALPRRRDLGEIHRDAAELHAGGESLKEASDENDQGRRESRSSRSPA